MNHRPIAECPCTVCADKGSGILPLNHPEIQSEAQAPAKRGRKRKNAGSSFYYPPKQSFDTLQSLVKLLARQGTLALTLKGPRQVSTSAPLDVLHKLYDKIRTQNATIPRIGEIVLFIRHLDKNYAIRKQDGTDEFKVYDTSTDEYGTHPQWEAGVVTQAADIHLKDFAANYVPMENEALTGFRVEPLPDCGSQRKGSSKSYTYVPASRIRPWILRQEMLNGIPSAQWHQSVQHAIKVVNTFSLTGECMFSGHWPNATMFYRGVYKGAELLLQGDIVRLLPPSSRHKQGLALDVLYVSAIAMDLRGLSGRGDGSVCDSTINLVGPVYTTEPVHTSAGISKPLSEAEKSRLPAGMGQYSWYYHHEPGKYAKIPLSKILGRCFETRGTELLLGSRSGEKSYVQLLNYGFPDYEEMSTFSKTMDQGDEHQTAHVPRLIWANSRAEALGIQEVNGYLLSEDDGEGELGRPGFLLTPASPSEGLKEKSGWLERANSEVSSVREQWRAMELKESSTDEDEVEVKEISHDSAGLLALALRDSRYDDTVESKRRKMTPSSAL